MKIVNEFSELHKFANSTEPDFFGSDTADSEDYQSLEKYFVKRPEYDLFVSDLRRFHIVRARKGLGKSALLKHTAYLKSLQDTSDVVHIVGPSLSSSTHSMDTPQDQVAAWTSHLCEQVLKAVTKNIKTPKTRIEYLMLHRYGGIAERRSWFGTLVAVATLRLPFVALKNENLIDHHDVLGSYLSEKDSRTVWLLVDDIDASYMNTPRNNGFLAAFFTATRLLSDDFPNIRIRASVRRDVWATIRRRDEALDKCEEHVLDIEWSRNGILAIISGRIRSSIIQAVARAGFTVSQPLLSEVYQEGYEADKKLFRIVFDQKFAWGGGQMESNQLVSTLSAGRPRWAIQLCRMAAKKVLEYKGPNKVIKFGHVKTVLPAYSRSRLNDTVVEFKHQCEAVESLLYSFSNRTFEYETHEILHHIESRILSVQEIHIDEAVAGLSDIGAFLFRIGFIEAVDKRKKNIHYRFEDMPHFFRALPADHSFIKWNVAASFRSALGET